MWVTNTLASVKVTQLTQVECENVHSFLRKQWFTVLGPMQGLTDGVKPTAFAKTQCSIWRAGTIQQLGDSESDLIRETNT